MIHTQRRLAANYSSLHVGKQCFKVTQGGFEVVDEIATSQEESDTHTHVASHQTCFQQLSWHDYCGRRHRCVYHFPFSIPSDK